MLRTAARYWSCDCGSTAYTLPRTPEGQPHTYNTDRLTLCLTYCPTYRLTYVSYASRMCTITKTRPTHNSKLFRGNHFVLGCRLNTYWLIQYSSPMGARFVALHMSSLELVQSVKGFIEYLGLILLRTPALPLEGCPTPKIKNLYQV